MADLGEIFDGSTIDMESGGNRASVPAARSAPPRTVA